MSMTRRIAGHSLHYGTAQILIMAAGVISMPIFTRVMSKAEYGMMNIIGITILLAMNIFSGGVRRSYIRHYGEFREKGTLASSLSTYLTCVWVLGLAGVIATALGFWALAAWNVIPSWALQPTPPDRSCPDPTPQIAAVCRSRECGHPGGALQPRVLLAGFGQRGEQSR